MPWEVIGLTFPGAIGAFRVFDGRQGRFWRAILGLRGCRGRPNTASAESASATADGCALVARRAGDHEAGEVVGEDPFGAVPGRCLGWGFGGVRRGWMTTVSGRPAHAMLNISRLARGCCAPLRPPTFRPPKTGWGRVVPSARLGRFVVRQQLVDGHALLIEFTALQQEDPVRTSVQKRRAGGDGEAA